MRDKDEGNRVLDIHIHTGYIHNTFFSPESVAKMVRDEKIIALSSSLSGYNLGQQFANDETAKLVELAEGRIGGLAWFCPYDPTCIEEAERRLEEGFFGIKLHPQGNLYDVTVEFLSPAFEIASRFDVPIVTHTKERERQTFFTNAAVYEPLIREFPNVILILYHFRPPEEAMILAYKYANVFLGTASHKAETVYLATRAVGSRKILFGTDAPFGLSQFPTIRVKQATRSYSSILSELRAQPFSEEELDDILWRNAQELFRFPC